MKNCFKASFAIVALICIFTILYDYIFEAKHFFVSTESDGTPGSCRYTSHPGYIDGGTNLEVSAFLDENHAQLRCDQLIECIGFSYNEEGFLIFKAHHSHTSDEKPGWTTYLKDQCDLKKPRFLDVVIPIAPEDQNTLFKLGGLDSFMKNLVGARNFYLVGLKRPDVERNDFYFFEEDKVTTCDMVEKGWYYQQCLKFAVWKYIPDLSDPYLVLDADVVFLKPLQLISDVGRLTYIEGDCPGKDIWGGRVGRQPIDCWSYKWSIERWMSTSERNVSLEYAFNKLSRVSHLMIMQRAIIQEMDKFTIEDKGESIYKYISYKKDGSWYLRPSEYWFYSTWLNEYHADIHNVRKIPYLNVATNCSKIWQDLWSLTDIVYMACHDHVAGRDQFFCMNSRVGCTKDPTWKRIAALMIRASHPITVAPSMSPSTLSPSASPSGFTDKDEGKDIEKSESRRTLNEEQQKDKLKRLTHKWQQYQVEKHLWQSEFQVK